MSETGTRGPDAPVEAPAIAHDAVEAAAGPGGLSRRRVLQAGLAAVPALCGARLLSAVVGAPADEVRAAAAAGGPATAGAAAADAPPYDPSAHDWGFVIDTTTCIGCGRCVDACKQENHVPEEPEINRTWVELHVLDGEGNVTITSPDGGREGFPADEAPDVADVQAAYFVPRTCMQCENPPCTWVCPVSATFRMEDGVVFVDENRCIGCGYCMLACPYGARYIVPAGEQTPKGVAGIVDKCTFCYQRITRDLLPACAEVCPANARIFGDLRDPESPASIALSENRVRVMKPSLGTRPRVWYIGLQGEVY